MKVTELFEGDPRCASLLEAVLDTVYERGDKLPLPSVLGVLEMAKLLILEAQNKK